MHFVHSAGMWHCKKRAARQSNNLKWAPSLGLAEHLTVNQQAPVRSTRKWIEGLWPCNSLPSWERQALHSYLHQTRLQD